MPTSTNSARDLYSLIKDATIIDLSVTTGNNWPVSPAEGQRFQQYVANYYTWPRGEWLGHVQVHDDHTGTHIDAPCHMIPPVDSGLPHANAYGSITIDQLPIEQMIGPAVVIDCRSLIDGFPKGDRTRLKESPVITRAYVAAWERENGQLQAGEIVLFRTDWSDKYYVPYPDGFGYDRSHPAPGVDAYELLEERGVRCIGVDTRGIGLMQDDFGPHRACLGRNILAVENLTNLGKLPIRGALFLFLPHKFEGASGGIGRAIGIITG